MMASRISGLALAAVLVGCAAEVEDERVGESADSVSYADLRVRRYLFDVDLIGSRTCTTPGCSFRVRFTLRNAFNATIKESCSTVYASEASPFGDVGTVVDDMTQIRVGIPGVADARSLEITVEEGQFSPRTSSWPRPSFGSCAAQPNANARTIASRSAPFDHDRDAASRGNIIEVAYWSNVDFDLDQNSITVSRRPIP